jgi:ComF family protein
MSDPLANLLSELDWDMEVIIPVPLGVARLKERGYNQAVLIARPLALRLDLPCETRGLHRVRETRSQVGLTINQRRENVRNAFLANMEKVSKRRILVVDDVATSSATLDACALALLEAGAKAVHCVTLARTG